MSNAPDRKTRGVSQRRRIRLLLFAGVVAFFS